MPTMIVARAENGSPVRDTKHQVLGYLAAPVAEAAAVEGAPAADAAVTAPGAAPAAAGAKKEPEKKEGDKGAKK